ncbi:invasion associated locus B family protein [Hoeflea sp. YIM 152468]|uniref:invasion associated locus B family protein n=1 Tax=Hoeflea sp. YIM 152468 TaxID=3031759 RepID=UPI0023DCD8BA|nr:invasion associated locus B family protein [Hoeflea sp. YIM 152468]MDF1606906.1 invasion associated locus B family protein [Hoeflea sp. YIM 152468]
MAAAAIVQPVFAQTSAAPATTVETAKNNWSVNCAAGETADAPLTCQMVQNVVVVESNQRLLTVVIRPEKESPNHTLTLALPHGVDFLKGVEVSIDDKEAFNLPVQTSNPQGAFSNLPISDALLASLKAGTSMEIIFHAVSGQSYTLPISLIGFSSAYGKLSSG